MLFSSLVSIHYLMKSMYLNVVDYATFLLSKPSVNFSAVQSLNQSLIRFLGLRPLQMALVIL